MIVSARWERSDFRGVPLRYWCGRMRYFDMERLGRCRVAMRPGVKDKIASEEEKQEQKQAEDQYQDLLRRVKEVLGEQIKEVRADQYGIRTLLRVTGQPIKFEIVLEGRIQLAAPTVKDEICGVTTLTPLDMATSKLLANSDRWADDGVFSRDVIDLAMMKPSLALLRQALLKAHGAYGNAIRQDLDKALLRLQTRHGWLERCMQAMAMVEPKAVVWQRLRALRRN